MDFAETVARELGRSVGWDQAKTIICLRREWGGTTLETSEWIDDDAEYSLPSAFHGTSVVTYVGPHAVNTDPGHRSFVKLRGERPGLDLATCWVGL